MEERRTRKTVKGGERGESYGGKWEEKRATGERERREG